LPGAPNEAGVKNNFKLVRAASNERKWKHSMRPASRQKQGRQSRP